MVKVLNYEKVGNRIQKFRIQRNLTQQELAAIIDISVSHLSNIETGKTIASLEVMFKIANALKVSVDELLRENVSHEFALEKHILFDCNDAERVIILQTISTLKRSLREQDPTKDK